MGAILLLCLLGFALPVILDAGDGVLDEVALQDLVLPDVNCHASLCNLKQGFFVKDENITRIYLADTNNQKVCFSFQGHAALFCQANSAVSIPSVSVVVQWHGWVDFPLQLFGRHVLTIHKFPPDSLTEKRLVECFIQKVENFPTWSWQWSEVVYPPYGSIIDSRRLLIKLQHSQLLLREKSQVAVRLVQVRDLLYHNGVDTLDTLGHTAIEPGSYFVEVGPSSPASDLGAVHSLGYMEHVLSPEEIAQNRRFYAPPSSPGVLRRMTVGVGLLGAAVVSSDDVAVSAPTAKGVKHRICLWTSDIMDGQKNIWLQQMASLNRSEYDFTVILTENNDLGTDTEEITVMAAGLETRLRAPRNGFALKVRSRRLADISLNPANALPIQLVRLSEVPGDGTPAFSDLIDEPVSQRSLMVYVVERLELFRGREEDITPLWVRDFVGGMLNFTRGLDCDVLVYGNDRASSSDALIPALGDFLGIPSVSELLNLFVSSIPTVIVGPSHYSVEHPTVHHANTTSDYQGFGRPKVADIRVISPGIDLDRFDPRAHEGRDRAHPGRQTFSAPVSALRNTETEKRSPPPFVIGFVGRLSVEKNVGLFLLAAQRLLVDEGCANCRFTVVGDGPIRSRLEMLCAQLDIAWAVHFAGWQHEAALPSLLAGMDVVVNPSLRAWSETFCIVNIEVMAMQVPLITFAVGGVGEYVRDPGLATPLSSEEESSQFSVGENALVLHEASPEAICNAVLYLRRRPDLTASLGAAGRATVKRSFSLGRQMRQYDQLYSSLWRG